MPRLLTPAYTQHTDKHQHQQHQQHKRDSKQRNMLLRVRSKVGTWRVEGVGPELTVAALRSRVLAEHGVTPHPSQVFSLDPAGARVVGDEQTVGGLGLQHGDLVHLAIREEDCAHEAGKKIAADGSIVNKTHLEASRERGFRPGMMSLRSMKMHWTLTDFVELDAQFEYKIKAQKNEDPWCTKAIMEPACGNDFQSYMRRLGFNQCRMGYLYGTFTDAKEVKVEVLYEPPQEGTHEGFELLEDPRAEKVDALATALGLTKVGWIFAHPPREEGFVFSGLEIMQAAMGQLEAADGVKGTPFVTVRVSLAPAEKVEGEEAKEGAPTATVAHFDAFQVSLQCMEMVAEGAVESGDEPGAMRVNESFTAIVEGRGAKTVDNNFFLVNVPVGSEESKGFLHKFPKWNRLDELPDAKAMAAQLSQAGKAGWRFVDLLGDFHLLVFLTEFLEMSEMEVVCASVRDKESVPLGEGHVALIRAIAGMD